MSVRSSTLSSQQSPSSSSSSSWKSSSLPSSSPSSPSSSSSPWLDTVKIIIIYHLLLTSSLVIGSAPSSHDDNGNDDDHHDNHYHHRQQQDHHHQDERNDPVFNSCVPPPEVGNKTCREQPLSMVEMALNARTLLYGKIINTYKDKRVENHPRVSVFTAEMQVYCIIKGEVTQEVVNISEAGYVPGRCYKSNLEQGREYVVVVYPIGGLLCTVDDEIPASLENMESIIQACDLNPRYPYGVTEDMAVKKCPSVLKHPACLNNEDYSTTEPNNYNHPIYDEEIYSWSDVNSDYDNEDQYATQHNLNARHRISVMLYFILLVHIFI